MSPAALNHPGWGPDFVARDPRVSPSITLDRPRHLKLGVRQKHPGHIQMEERMHSTKMGRARMRCPGAPPPESICCEVES